MYDQLMMMGRLPHVLLVPFLAQGHISPLMKLANAIADRGGIKVTFVNTEITHTLIATARDKSKVHSQVTLESVPDRLELGDSRRDVIKFMRSLLKVMSGHLQDLIGKMNESGEKVTCVVVDTTLGWLLEDVKKMGVKCAAFSPAVPAAVAAAYNIPKPCIPQNCSVMRKDSVFFYINDLMIRMGNDDYLAKKEFTS